MKKLFYLLLLVPFALFSSCDKDDDIAPFDMTITMSGVTRADNAFYTVAGETASIDNFEVKGTGNKATDYANVMFFLSGAPIIPNPWASDDVQPYSFSTENLEPGVYSIDVSGNLLQVDASLQNFVASYKFVVVESEEDLPSGAPEIGTYSATINYTK